jgi:hypothetical protein
LLKMGLLKCLVGSLTLLMSAQIECSESTVANSEFFGCWGCVSLL